MASRRALLVASSDLSHYQDSSRAALLDRVIVDAIERFDPEAVERALARDPGHACGGGPIVAVMRAARALGAADARVLCYADSGAVSGDKQRRGRILRRGARHVRGGGVTGEAHGVDAPLSAEDRHRLLAVARAAVADALAGRPPRRAEPAGILARRAGVFVSFHLDGDLRGCIGSPCR